ncbi:putative DNA or RNA helicases of superfamily II [Thiomonas arsenitoxydans]|nr:putative DNA or RNA helicases of superfamily II [Thiomonas arsenitoxydans]CQR34732.1 putative DNA or RNA helicases of superfamily II [Thiomonas arsenitoxydans]CQR34807.1 putative DNA or RNA helicases of superfamily II [Thiomonas arsenitoxydans]
MDMPSTTESQRKLRAAELQPVRDAMGAAMASYFEQHAAQIALLDEVREFNLSSRATGAQKRPMPEPLPPLGILATVGLGKGVGVTPVVSMAHSAGLPVVILVPTHQLAQEYAERLKPFGAVVYQGRREPSQSQPNEAPSDPGAHACYRLERVADAGDQNHRPAQGLCGKCPNGQAGVLQFVSRDQMRVQRATDFFKARGMDPAKTPPCQFLFRGLPDQLSA